MKVHTEYWEADEYVLVVNGEVFGGTHHKRDANTIARFLNDYGDHLIRLYAPKDDDYTSALMSI